MGSYMGHEYDSAAPAERERQKPKYKVGQRVRVVKDGTREGGSAHGADIGEVFKVFSIGELGVYAGDWYLWWGEFAAAFQPGDSVRVTRCNAYFAAGDTGVVVSVSGDNVTICTDDCPIVCRSIEADKLEWLGSGEQPKAGAEPKPKFKAGDVVRCLKNYGNQFTKGNTYTVRSDWPGYGNVLVTSDDNGSASNGWSAAYFELVIPAPCPQDNARAVSKRMLFGIGLIQGPVIDGPCIVARVDSGGQPTLSALPHVHPDSASAIAEAERLARNNPGQEYAVYQRVAGRVAEQHVEMKEVA